MKRGDLVGVDVGGTFTDVFVLNLDEGNISVAKVPTQHQIGRFSRSCCVYRVSHRLQQ